MNKFQIIFISAAFASSLGGQTLYLDTNGATSGSGFINPVSWDSAVWSTSSAGTAATGTWVAGSSAYFSAGPGGEVGTRILTLSTDVQISGISAYNENLQIDSAGGALTNSGNLSIIGSNSININADVNLGTNGLIYNGNNSLTLGGNNTFSTLTVNGTVSVGQASAGAFGTGRIIIGTGILGLSSVDVNARVITGNVTREHVANAQNYTGTVVAGSNTLQGAVNSHPEYNGAFSAANIVLSHTSARLEYNTTGTVTIDAGTLQMPGTTVSNWYQNFGTITNNNGTFALHSFGRFQTYNVTGDVILNNGTFTPFDSVSPTTGISTIEMMLTDAESSRLLVSGTAYLGGNLVVLSSGAFDQYDGMAYDLIDAGSIVGTFSNITLPTLFDGLGWDTTQLYTTGTLLISAVPEPAAYGLTLGVVALVGVAFRRRKARVL